MSSLRERMNRLRGEKSGETGTDTAQLIDQAAEGAAGEATLDDQYTLSDSDEKEERLHPGWSSFGVAMCETEQGSFLLRRKLHSHRFHHGTHALGELIGSAPGLSSFHPSEEAPQAGNILYLDLETTGLGAGAGNLAFMVGIAYLEETGFITEQMMIRHPAEEYAMLHYLVEKLRDFTYLATYNGKTFDWPLLQSRMVMNGLHRGLWEPLHLDFLHPSRSIWRNTLQSCRLSHVEEERLGIYRSEDVPGSLAPQLYFQYLSDGDPIPLEGVFKHNEWDLMSLACLSIRFGQLLEEVIFTRIPYPDHPEELVRTGLWLEKMGREELSAELYEKVAGHPQAEAATLNRLASRDKKAGNWQRAVVLWQRACSRMESETGYCASRQQACVELSMHYEHRLKDVECALHYAKDALGRAERYMGMAIRDKKRRQELEALQVRVERLKRKLQRSAAHSG
ncbi:ribonuclease H-like domain-containing protein [Paenibacillus chungangensis]|uniref:Ribonuclease H-like domain-containing protein n=1 Tax=Paenibacillus chungangensis TaxID=696535 RepID=A0ABW3HN77_9BACL